MKYLAIVAVATAVYVGTIGIAFTWRDEPKPLDLTTLTNEQFARALGEPIGRTVKGCPFSTEPNLETTIYVVPEQRGIAVCEVAPLPGPAQ